MFLFNEEDDAAGGLLIRLHGLWIPLSRGLISNAAVKEESKRSYVVLIKICSNNLSE